jgi:hypothetical protein
MLAKTRAFMRREAALPRGRWVTVILASPYFSGK